jgi:hypothetical protein
LAVRGRTWLPALVLAALASAPAAAGQSHAQLEVGATVIRSSEIRTAPLPGGAMASVAVNSAAAANVLVLSGALAKDGEGRLAVRARPGERLVLLSIEY